MSMDDERRLQRILLEGFGGGDLSVIDELVAEDLVEHQAGLPAGREGLKAVITRLRGAFPDLSVTVVDTISDGEKVWGHFRSRGTHGGPWMGMQPTGRPIEIDVIDIARFENGQLAEHWGVPDRFALLEQIGFLTNA